MEEKIYKTMGGSGALNIAVGVVVLVVGVASGTLLLIRIDIFFHTGNRS